MNRIFSSILIAFGTGTLQAQSNAVIEGYVTDGNSGDTLTGAVVSLDKKYAATTDTRGRYNIPVPAGTYALECRLAGYDLWRQTVSLREGAGTRLDIRLNANANPIEEVVVSVDRFEQKIGEVTVSTDIIKPALIANKNIVQLDDALNQVPGVVVMDGQASIRGGSGFSYGAGSRVLMLVDEIPMISADAGDIKWNYLPIENLEQVEVVKGASSVLYGSGALNGVINLRSAFARSEPRTRLTLFYGGYDASRNTYKWWKKSSQAQRGLNFSHAQKIGRVDLVIGAHSFGDDGYRMLETESRDRFNANLRYSFAKLPQLSAGLNMNMMNTQGGLFFLWKHYDTAYVPAGNEIQRYNNNRINFDPWVTWTGKGDSLGNYSISLRNRYFKTQNTNDKEQGSLAELYYSELRYAKTVRSLNFTTGAMRMEQMVLGDSLYGKHRGVNTAVYAQISGRWFNRLTVTAGIRAEHFRVDTAQTTGYFLNNGKGPTLPFQPVFRFGTNYRIAKVTYLRASLGQGYRFPSVAEKFVNTSVSVLRVFPNPSLQPERAFSGEVSLKQGFGIGGFRGYIDFAAFYTRYRNMIEFVFDVYRPGGATGNFIEDLLWVGFKSQNVSDARIAGGEVGVNAAGMLGPVKATVFSGYTYVDPVQPGFDPARDTLGLPGVRTLKYRSRHLIKGDVQLEYRRWGIGYSARYQSRIENIDRRFVMSVLEEYNGFLGVDFSSDPSTYILPGMKENFPAYSKPFVVQDARVTFQATRQIRLAFIVNNFMNMEYQTRPGDMAAPTMYIGQLVVQL